MAELDENYMPYAPGGTVVSLLRRLREHGLPDIIDNATITRVGVTEGNAGRTVAALKFLGIIDGEGNKTEVHDRLARVSSAEYPDVLAEIVRKAYGHIFKVVNPANATDVQLDDAFRKFEPAKQRGRMVILFVGLCQEAGIISGQPTVVQRRTTNPSGITGSKNGAPKPRDRKGEDPTPPLHTPPVKREIPVNERYEMLAAVFKKLPENGTWTKKEKELWLKGVSVAAEIEVELLGDTANSE